MCLNYYHMFSGCANWCSKCSAAGKCDDGSCFTGYTFLTSETCGSMYIIHIHKPLSVTNFTFEFICSVQCGRKIMISYSLITQMVSANYHRLSLKNYVPNVLLKNYAHQTEINSDLILEVHVLGNLQLVIDLYC